VDSEPRSEPWCSTDEVPRRGPSWRRSPVRSGGARKAQPDGIQAQTCVSVPATAFFTGNTCVGRPPSLAEEKQRLEALGSLETLGAPLARLTGGERADTMLR
jgi:hypothetical protein